MMRHARKYVFEKNDTYLFYQNVAINGGFIGFLTAGIFIDRLSAEMMYWFPLFNACFYNIYYLKKGDYKQSDAKFVT